eukprot:6909417-Prymnesium_polylepis.1
MRPARTHEGESAAAAARAVSVGARRRGWRVTRHACVTARWPKGSRTARPSVGAVAGRAGGWARGVHRRWRRR